MSHCLNPECGAALPPSKRGNKHCDHTCLQRHLELLRGQCARQGCEHYLPPKRHGSYCSRACYDLAVLVPRRQCAFPGCTASAARAHGTYCGFAHAQEAEQARRKEIGFFKDMSEAGRDARSAAVAQSNREQPRRRR